MKKAAIIDAQTIQTLSVSKSLKNQGFHVTLICTDKKSYGYHSRYADRKIIVPPILKDEQAFHLFFIDFLRNEKIDVVIPMIDNSARYLSKNKEILEKYTNFIIPPYDIFLNAYNKNRLMKLCADKGFPHPDTIDLSTVEISELENKVKFPALIKPNYSSGARGIAIVHSIDEIKAKLPQIMKIYGECHLQDFIPPGGHQYKVEIFICSGELINSTAIDKLRFYPPQGGSSCYIQTIQRDDLVNTCFALASELSWEGFIDFDLIEDPRDHVVKIMEINPRVPSTIKASIISGVDFIENIVDCSLKRLVKKYDYSPGKYMRYLGMDILWLFTSKRRVKEHPSWLKTLFSKNEYLEDGSLDDIMPFFFGTIGSILKQMNPNFRAAKKEMT